MQYQDPNQRARQPPETPTPRYNAPIAPRYPRGIPNPRRAT